MSSDPHNARDFFEKQYYLEVMGSGSKGKSKEYHVGAEEMRQKLNSVSPSFCLAKWKMVSLHLTNGKTQSCYHNPAHSIPTDELENNPGRLHNTQIKIDERAQMRAGERPKGCSYCWAVEDAKSEDKGGHISDRHYRSSEWWVADSFEQIRTPNRELDENVTPSYVEVNFNQACNFKCIYCSPHLSSEWQKEINQYGSFNMEEIVHNDIPALQKTGLMPLAVPNEENPYVKAFWAWWPQIYSQLKVFRMTGGEPLIDANTWRVLDYVHQNPNAQLELFMTSNLCPPKPEIFDRFISQLQKLEQVQIWEDSSKLNLDSGNFDYVSPAIKYFMLFVSCDSVGAQAEYIRTGMNFTILKSNVESVLKKTNGTAVSFINTFNLLSLPKLKEFLQWILELRETFSFDSQNDDPIEIPDKRGIKHRPYVRKKRQRIWFDIPMLSYPPWLNVKLLAGTEWEQHIEDCLRFMESNLQKDDYDTSFRGFKPYEILKLKRNLAVMKQGFSEADQTLNEKRFAQYVNELDRRRGTRFLSAFPEMESFYNKAVRHL